MSEPVCQLGWGIVGEIGERSDAHPVCEIGLDKVIQTMRETGAHRMTTYKEAARGGLAVNIVAC